MIGYSDYNGFMTLKLKTALYLKVRKLDFNATLHLKSWGREKSHMKF